MEKENETMGKKDIVCLVNTKYSLYFPNDTLF